MTDLMAIRLRLWQLRMIVITIKLRLWMLDGVWR